MLRNLCAVEFMISGSIELLPKNLYENFTQSDDYSVPQHYCRQWVMEKRSDILITPSARKANGFIYVCNLGMMRNRIKIGKIVSLV